MKDTVLMIAFHFPPASMGSGQLRTLGFASHLPALGWEPVVLSAHARAYPRVDAAHYELVPQACHVHRAFALDARRHLGLRGRYPAFLAQPDRWISWWPGAVWRGLRLIHRYPIRAIWSTYPIMTAHCIAYTLSRLTGLPWIADFRDPVMSTLTEQGRSVLSIQQRWERRVLQHADLCVFTTPGALGSYAEAYPEVHREGRLTVIPNGFDETAVPAIAASVAYTPGRPLRLVHSGILYRTGRNPVPFFMALAHLKASGTVTAAELSVTLRASGSEMEYGAEIQRLGLEGMVTLAPPISHTQALTEQAEADALLLFQGEEYDRQIPAKLYEYLHMGRPIFALVGAQGDTAAVLRETGGADIVPPDNADAIAGRLAEFIRALQGGGGPTADKSAVRKYSRKEGAVHLAALLNEVSGRALVKGSRDAE